MKLNPFKLPTAEQAAREELASAELQLLEAHTMEEHATAMLRYHQMRVARLRALVAAHDQVRVEGDTVRLPVVDWPTLDEFRKATA